MSKTKQVIIITGDHGMPDDYPYLAIVESQACEISHYIDEDQEDGLIPPKIIKELKSMADLAGIEYEETVLCDNSMGATEPEYDIDIEDEGFWEDIQQALE